MIFSYYNYYKHIIIMNYCFIYIKEIDVNFEIFEWLLICFKFNPNMLFSTNLAR